MNGLEPGQAEALRRELLRLSEELRRSLESSAEGARPVDLEQPIGRVSRMDAMQQQSMAQANRRATQQKLQQVEAALRRFDQEEYGICAECGQDVAFVRLEVRPEAPFCVDCQSLRERR